MSDAWSELPHFAKLAELSPEELTERQDLVRLVTGLCRSIMQSGYYSPDHPQARRVVEEPLDLLHRVGLRWPELTIIVTAWRDDEHAALDGVFSEPVTLEELIGGTVGEHFDGKLKTFCKRNRLVSFSLKTSIEEAEFHRFVEVFVRRHVDMEANRLLAEASPETATGPRFTEQLLDVGVVNVTVVLEDDLVEERRRLPWRVRVAMARLKKDLHLVPIFAKASAMELRAAKMRLLSDILRPLRQGAFLRQLFLNLDLIAASVAELQGVDLERDLVEALPGDRVLLLGQSLLQEVEHRQRRTLGYTEAEQREDLDETVQRQLGLVGELMAGHHDDPKAVTLLRELYDIKAVALSALPRVMQERIRLERWTASFLADAGAFLSALDRLESADAYVRELPNIVAIVPKLLEMRRWDDANRIIETLARHRDEPGGFARRQAIVAEAMTRFDHAEVLRLLVHAMETEPAEAREPLRRLFALMGSASVSPLVRILEDTERDDVCTDAALTLVAVGQAGATDVAAVLQKRGLKRHTARYLLKVLGEIGTAASGEVIASYLRHPAPKVRDAANEAAARVYGVSAATALVAALDDDEPGVACHAIHLLERVASRHRLFVLKLVALLGPARPEKPVAEAVQVAAVTALGRMGNLAIGERGTLEDVLLACVEKPAAKGLGALLGRTAAPSRSEAFRGALYDALGTIGTERAAAELMDATSEPNVALKERRARAVKAIRGRA